MRVQRAGVIVAKDDKLLCVRNVDSGYWGFPKGRKTPSETYIEAAARELYEETGLKFQLDNAPAINTYCAQLYVLRVDTEPVVTVDKREIDEFKWLTLAELKVLRTSIFTKKFIKCYEAFQCGKTQIAKV